MQVTLLYFDGCPNWQTAETRVREALDRLGHAGVLVTRQRVASAAQAEELGFRGSPTILVDGRDPFADADAQVGLSCRVYQSDEGLAGAPSVDQLLAALT